MAGMQPIAIAVDRAVAAPITVDSARCVATRHRASECRACIEACDAQALRFEAGRVVVDALACNGCLACVSSCPTEAVVADGEADCSLSTKADAALETAGGVAVFACHRAMDRADVDLRAVTSVPCLARLDESLLCEQAARGAYEIALVDAGCAGCPRAACDAVINETVACANALLDVCEAGVAVERMHAFPAEVLREESDDYDASRRFLFTQVSDFAKEQALKAADDLVRKPEDAAMPLDAISPMVTIEVQKRMRIMDALDTMSAPATSSVDIRRFHTVGVDASKCVGCGVCAMFCPTGALHINEAGSDGTLEWSAAECVGCRLCHDVCACDAITLSPGVTCGELLDFEPRTLRGGAEPEAPVVVSASSSWGTPRGSVACRFFSGNRAVDPAAEGMRARVGVAKR